MPQNGFYYKTPEQLYLACLRKNLINAHVDITTPTLSANMRYSQILENNLRGRPRFISLFADNGKYPPGFFYVPLGGGPQLSYLGTIHGQPGGIGSPPRNKF